MPSDIWMPVKGFEGYYEVSMYGLVRSLDRIITYKCGRVRKYHKKLVKASEGETGYMTVMLSANRRTKRISVHRLVYENHVGIKEGYDINHIDCDKKNNALYNLECITHKENMHHAMKSGALIKGSNGKFVKK